MYKRWESPAEKQKQQLTEGGVSQTQVWTESRSNQSQHYNIVIQKTREIMQAPVRAFFATLAFAFHPERADMRTISLVVWRRACQLQQHIARSHRLADRSNRQRTVGVCNLPTSSQKKKVTQDSQNNITQTETIIDVTKFEFECRHQIARIPSSFLSVALRHY